MEIRVIAASRDYRQPRRFNAALIAGCLAAVLALPTASTAQSASIGLSSGDMQRFASRMGLSGTQRSQVNTITQNLIRENTAILQRHGLRVGTCSDLGPIRLSAVSGEINGAFSRARGQLSAVLTPEQLREYSSIYQARKRAAQNTIVCNSRSS